MRVIRVAAVAALAALSVRCTPAASTPSTPSAATSTSTYAGAGPAHAQGAAAPLSTMSIIGQWTAGGASGDLRINPGSARGVAPLDVSVNFCHSDAAPEALRFHADWGDGSSSANLNCHLEHTYTDAGQFSLVACVWDRDPAHAPGSCTTIDVQVSAAGRFCHEIASTTPACGGGGCPALTCPT